MKKQEELNALKEEVETVSRNLHELTDEELAQVSGGGFNPIPDDSKHNTGDSVSSPSMSVNDGKCGKSVPLLKGICEKIVLGTQKDENICAGCKYF